MFIEGKLTVSESLAAIIVGVVAVRAIRLPAACKRVK